MTDKEKVERKTVRMGKGVNGTMEPHGAVYAAHLIPVVPYMDNKTYNPYPVFTITAKDESTGEVLAVTQARLDQLLEEERELNTRVDVLRAEIDGPEVVTESNDARDLITVPSLPNSSIAELLKTTLRDETHLDDTI